MDLHKSFCARGPLGVMKSERKKMQALRMSRRESFLSESYCRGPYDTIRRGRWGEGGYKRLLVEVSWCQK